MIHKTNAPSGGPTTTCAWNGCAWTESNVCKGNGVVAEGILRNFRIHGVTGVEGNFPSRFVALQLEIVRCWKRRWGDTGVEIQPDEKKTQLQRSGYLTAARVQISSVDDVPPAQLGAIINSQPGFPPSAQKSKLHPSGLLAT